MSNISSSVQTDLQCVFRHQGTNNTKSLRFTKPNANPSTIESQLRITLQGPANTPIHKSYVCVLNRCYFNRTIIIWDVRVCAIFYVCVWFYAYSAYGHLTVRSLLDTIEHCMKEFDFPDPYLAVSLQSSAYVS